MNQMQKEHAKDIVIYNGKNLLQLYKENLNDVQNSSDARYSLFHTISSPMHLTRIEILQFFEMMTSLVNLLGDDCPEEWVVAIENFTTKLSLTNEALEATIVKELQS